LRRLSFTTFPDGWPGLGLLLLRTAVGITAGLQGGAYLSNPGKLSAWMWITGCLMLVSGAFLLVGFLTPIADLLIALDSIGFWLSWFPLSTPKLFDNGLSFFFLMMMAAAIVLLGPGAYSLDARLFGRREIIIPPASHSPKF
jgi:uncharacterized membrane protein YphA (DoxX/SURF4 family)